MVKKRIIVMATSLSCKGTGCFARQQRLYRVDMAVNFGKYLSKWLAEKIINIVKMNAFKPRVIITISA